ncbi:MAG: MotA/TolQ/ExbB proton channel family protein [Myxococcales bacterium]|nr:MotA/TolQ/ExbB proton channel family protein [Myxococcales bacterium]
MLQDGMMAFALLGVDWVLWLLVIMSVLCIGVSIERAVYLMRDGTDRSKLQRAFQDFLGGGSRDGFHESLKGMEGYQARVLTSGLDLSTRGVDAAEKAMVSTVTAEKVQMERGLSLLATVGSNAPFVGLFGTVLGIIQAFRDLSVNTAEASEAVMAGISEALVATAVGLMVAIPAVVLYNLFIRFVKARQSRTESLANLLLARLEGDTPAVPAHGK